GIRDFHVTGVQTCALPIWAATAGDSRASPVAQERRADRRAPRQAHRVPEGRSLRGGVGVAPPTHGSAGRPRRPRRPFALTPAVPAPSPRRCRGWGAYGVSIAIGRAAWREMGVYVGRA